MGMGRGWEGRECKWFIPETVFTIPQEVHVCSVFGILNGNSTSACLKISCIFALEIYYFKDSEMNVCKLLS